MAGALSVSPAGCPTLNPRTELMIMNSLSTSSRIERVTESGSGKDRAKTAGDGLFAVGAIASLSGEPRPILIGDLQWLDGPELAIFTAYGDGPSDAHLVTFDEAVV